VGALVGVMHPAIGRFYIGYNVIPPGSVIGMVWGFFDAFIGGAIFAWLYNLLSKPAAAK
jgi:hypothetical protein